MKKYKNCYKIERATLTNVGSSKDVHVEFLKEWKSANIQQCAILRMIFGNSDLYFLEDENIGLGAVLWYTR